MLAFWDSKPPRYYDSVVPWRTVYLILHISWCRRMTQMKNADGKFWIDFIDDLKCLRSCGSCPAGDGYVAVGSTDVQVRLYNNASDKSLNRASTSIPGLGLPITAIDITFDGKWVIATTKSYLMVVKTVFRDKTGKETNAFKSRAGSSAPQPRLLRLKLEDADKTVWLVLSCSSMLTSISENGSCYRWCRCIGILSQ